MLQKWMRFEMWSYNTNTSSSQFLSTMVMAANCDTDNAVKQEKSYGLALSSQQMNQFTQRAVLCHASTHFIAIFSVIWFCCCRCCCCCWYHPPTHQLCHQPKLLISKARASSCCGDPLCRCTLLNHTTGHHGVKVIRMANVVELPDFYNSPWPRGDNIGGGLSQMKGWKSLTMKHQRTQIEEKCF